MIYYWYVTCEGLQQISYFAEYLSFWTIPKNYFGVMTSLRLKDFLIHPSVQPIFFLLTTPYTVSQKLFHRFFCRIFFNVCTLYNAFLLFIFIQRSNNFNMFRWSPSMFHIYIFWQENLESLTIQISQGYLLLSVIASITRMAGIWTKDLWIQNQPLYRWAITPCLLHYFWQHTW